MSNDTVEQPEPGHRTIPRSGLLLPRFLAMIVFGLAAFIGLPTAFVGLFSLFTGDWRGALVMASVWPIVLGLVWLGRLLWTGRPVSVSLICGMGAAIICMPTVILLSKGAWTQSFVFLTLLSSLLGVWGSALRGGSGDPVKPKAVDTPVTGK